MISRRHVLGLLASAPVALAAQPYARPTPHDELTRRARQAMTRHAGRIELTERFGTIDFGLHSSTPRLQIVDTVGGWARPYFCAHGKGSDPEHTGWLQRFSNEHNSLASSAGAYLTGEVYQGVHGTAMRLHGLDPGNANAYDRAVVLHSADYATPGHLASWGRLGRSDGCLVVDPVVLHEVIGLLGPGRLIFADRVSGIWVGAPA